MPFIKLEAGRIDKEKKEKLINGLTKVASETLGIPEAVSYTHLTLPTIYSV